MNACNICGTPLMDNPDSLHYDCGGDCLWCMARVGQDPDCIESVFDICRQRCLREMSKIAKRYSADVKEAGGDPVEFEMIIMEQWRPWL